MLGTENMKNYISWFEDMTYTKSNITYINLKQFIAYYL